MRPFLLLPLFVPRYVHAQPMGGPHLFSTPVTLFFLHVPVRSSVLVPETLFLPGIILVRITARVLLAGSSEAHLPLCGIHQEEESVWKDQSPPGVEASPAACPIPGSSDRCGKSIHLDEGLGHLQPAGS